MRIDFFGTSLVSGYGNGATTYCRGILRALANRGHAVRFYEPLDEERLMHRDILDPPWAQVIRFAPDGEGVEAALDTAAGADLIVKTGDIGVFDDLLDAAVPRATSARTLSVYWDLNPATTLAAIQADLNHPLRAQLPWYDLVLVRYGGDTVMEAFEALGARECFPVYNALDPHVHYRVDPDPDAASALAYFAHRHIERDTDVQQAFLDVAAALPARRFVLGGCGWDDVPMPANVHYVRYVYTAEHNRYHSSAAAVLGCSASANAQLGHSPAARLFEAVGADACVISDAWTGMEAFFEPDREVLIARDAREIVEHLMSLGPERAASIGRRAGERARVEHTYDRRAAELEALLEGFDRQWVNRTAL